MPMVAAGPAPPTTTATAADRVAPPVVPMQMPAMVMTDAYAKDAIISWFRGEFAAANAMIDALCGHLAQVAGGGGGGGVEYEAVFGAIHRRRLNWIPVLQMQKYHSIADVALELKKVAAKKAEETEKEKEKADEVKGAGSFKSATVGEKVTESEGKSSAVVSGGGNEEENVADVREHEDESPDSDITHEGSQEAQPPVENIGICSNHEDCDARASQIKLTKGFSAKEQVKGHTVNVVKGLKLYEDIFSDEELSKLNDFVNEMRASGQNGELPGETFILFNKQVKGNKRELIQLGVPIFGRVQEEAAGINIEPIPDILESVIDHLILWQLIPQYKKPNGCIINFFDEDEYSQPFLKPPHLDQPIATLLLSESTMAYGRILMSDNEGNYRGPLMLSLKEGSLLVMRGNSADMARHVMCSSPNKRVTITFFRVRPEANQIPSSPTSPLSNAMTVWQPSIPSSYAMPTGALNGHEAMMVPEWGVGVVRSPVVMLAAPMRPVVMSPRKLPRGGTGVFLPWTMNSRKSTKHLPPRAQKGRLLALPSPIETHAAEPGAKPGISAEGKC